MRKIAELKNISLINTEKDYLQDLMLFSLYSKIGKELIFKGGTCLYKIYKLNRFSEDLDFTLVKKIDLNKLSDKIILDFSLLNIKCKIKEIIEHKTEINIRFLFNGPLYKGNKETQCFIPLNLSLKEKVILEPKRETIIPLYKEIPSFELFVMQEQEILSEKIRAVMTRDKPRDVYDSWFLLTKKKVEPDFKLINKKLELYSLKFDLNHFKKAVNRKKGLWDTDLKNLIIGELPDFDKTQAEILNRFLLF
ncbi:MAG: nucleotidyl transferase AbiEii/AbiGii toxin family protein [Candidatus Omnitrophota bacterium]|nr:nucleotidyl transferase AbiEii/AbiGii toxin family protein [Candidatus Omnitrophota bacterium]